jgi:hypothetical protein
MAHAALAFSRMKAAMTEDTPDYPNTVRFWRLNTIEALKVMTWRHESQAEDPEEYAAILSRKAELRTLQARERAVRERYDRLLQRQNLNASKTP